MIHTEAELEALLAEPYPEDRAALASLQGNLILLGAGGKMGPSLARRARLAAPASLNIIAVSRSRVDVPGVESISADLLERGALDKLPDADHVIYLAARKFGTAEDSSATWATNSALPGLVAQRYANSRIISWSTGNVYPLTPASSGGATEQTPLAPVGEYGQSALARERVFDYFSRRHATPVCLLRLNYAIDLRYGVLVDLAQKVLRREPIDLSMGYVNVIWQGDANSICLRSFALCSSPPRALNVTGPATLSVRELALRFAREFDTTVEFDKTESPDALLSNAAECAQLFGPPRVSLDQMITWVAHWIRFVKVSLDKPTHFEVRDGRF